METENSFMSFEPTNENNVSDTLEKEDNNEIQSEENSETITQEKTEENDNKTEIGLNETDESDEYNGTEIDSVVNEDEEVEIDQSQIIPTLFERPVTRPNKTAQREIDEVSERALTGKRPSMREPRKLKPVKDYGKDALDNELNYSAEDKDFQRKKQLEIEETKRQVENYFGRNERKELEIEIQGLELKEDIVITLNQEAIKSLIILGLNQRYKKEGLRVHPEIDNEIEFPNVFKEDLFAKVTMQRVPIVKFVEE